MLEPNHEGNHVAWTKTAKFTWQDFPRHREMTVTV
jgi:hypothetical protein